MNLKPQDIVVALKLVALDGQSWGYVRLATELCMSASEINAAVKRGLKAGLLVPAVGESKNPLPNRKALEEFLVHGVRYAFPPDRGELTRGVPTSYAAPPLNSTIMQSNEPPPVWASPEGKVRGYSFSPLYPSVPNAVAADDELYELLVLVDAIRDSRTRERNLAVTELKKRLANVCRQ